MFKSMIKKITSYTEKWFEKFLEKFIFPRKITKKFIACKRRYERRLNRVKKIKNTLSKKQPSESVTGAVKHIVTNVVAPKKLSPEAKLSKTTSLTSIQSDSE